MQDIINVKFKSAWSDQAVAMFELVQHDAHRKHLPTGHSFTLQGEPVDYVWFVISGRARAKHYSESGAEHWSADFLPGDLFGQVSVLSGSISANEIQALDDMDVLYVPASRFHQLLKTKQKLGLNVAIGVSQRLQNVSRRLVELAILPAPARVCAELLRMAKPIGVHEVHKVIRPGPVHSNLALRVSSTRETVSRTISKLKKLGIISPEPGAVLVLKPDDLAAHIREK